MTDSMDNAHELNGINVLFIAAEADPLVKAGGLGDVAGSLPLAINRLNHEQKVDIRLAIPYYNSIRNNNIPVEKIGEFTVDTVDGSVLAEIFSTNVSEIPIYLIAGEPVAREDAIYGTDFKSDAEKFIFFSLACLKLPALLNWRCDILHANDWHTAAAIHQIRSIKTLDPTLQNTKTILTIHNLPFMGTGSEEALAKYKVSPSKNKNLPAWARELPLPMGLAAADQVIAVSPTYAKEIMTPEFGCDLQGFLQTRRARVSGILNGIDTRSWDPACDPALVKNFDISTLEDRIENKRALLQEFQLDQGDDIPLLVLISRMDRQKGVDIVIEGLRIISDHPWQVILLGTGDNRLEQDCKDLEIELAHKVRAAIRFDTNLSRRMYAGADILLMPSRYEPCGLSQMFAMRYGCLPVARATGGLVDTITDPKASSAGTGFLFSRIDPRSFAITVKRAIQSFYQKDDWRLMQETAMSQDFSWKRSAEQYVNLYMKLINNS